MKCVCGYEYLSNWELENRLEDEPNFVNGKEEFISLDINATYEKQGGYYNYNEKASIYACPKCGTLKMDL